jgi:anti-sigma factor RsiW
MSPCETVREQAQAWLDGELPLDERAALEAHLRGCAACRQVVARYRRLFGALDAPAVPAPPPTLVPAVLARVSAARARRERWVRRIAVAALVAVALGAGIAGWGYVSEAAEWAFVTHPEPAAPAQTWWEALLAFGQAVWSQAVAESADSAAEQAQAAAERWLGAVPAVPLLIVAALALLAGNASLAWRWRGLAALNGEHGARRTR